MPIILATPPRHAYMRARYAIAVAPWRQRLIFNNEIAHRRVHFIFVEQFSRMVRYPRKQRKLSTSTKLSAIRYYIVNTTMLKIGRTFLDHSNVYDGSCHCCL